MSEKLSLDVLTEVTSSQLCQRLPELHQWQLYLLAGVT